MRYQYKKVSLIQVDEDGALKRPSEFTNTCRNMNIIVQTTGGYAYSLNGKIETPKNTLANTTRDLLMNSSNKKEIWCFAYNYSIWISHQTENRLRGDVP